MEEAADGTRVLVGHSEVLTALAVSADGSRAATGSVDRSVRFWDLDAGVMLWAQGPADEAITALALSPQGDLIAAGDRGYQVRLLSTKDGSMVLRRPHPDSVSSVSFSPDGKWLAVAGFSGQAEIYPARSEAKSKCEVTARTLHFTDGGKRLVGANSSGAIFVMDLATCKKVKETSTQPQLPFSSVSGSATVVATHNGADPAVILWDAVAGKQLKKLDRQAAGVSSVSLSDDGKWASVASTDGRVRLYDVERGEVVRSAETGSVAFTTLSAHAEVLLYSTRVEARVVRLKGPP